MSRVVVDNDITNVNQRHGHDVMHHKDLQKGFRIFRKYTRLVRQMTCFESKSLPPNPGKVKPSILETRGSFFYDSLRLLT